MKVKLKKDLGLISVISIASGAMISSGIFILPGLAFARSGPAVILSYLLSAVLVLPAMFSKAELATAMPKAGGTYFFIERTFGSAIGTLAGMANWFSISLKSAFALIGIGQFAIYIYPAVTAFQVKSIAIICCMFFILINLRGVGHAGKSQIAMVFVIVGALILYIVGGFPDVQVQRLFPMVPFGAISVIGTAGLVFISYGGLTKIASVAEEIENPGRNIPLGMGLSLLFVTILYGLVIYVTVGVLDGSVLSGSLTPISAGAEAVFGVPGLIILSVAAMLAFVTTANAGILAASRGPMAMSRDGLLPHIFKRVNRRYKTPHYSIIFTGLFMIVVILFLNLENLIKTASTLMILLFMSINLAVIVMREAHVPNYQPKFRSPLYPWLQIVGILGYIFLIVEMGVVPLFIAVIFFICAFLWYWFYARIHVERQSALVCLIQRIANKGFPGEDIGSELREILRERDEIVEDRFDQLVRACTIVDIPERISMEDCFKSISGQLAWRLSMDAAEVEKMLLEREQETTTVIGPGLAIPHIIAEGSGIFELILVRSSAGVVFPGEDSPVHAIFVMVGSKDERNFHLRALMAIAQIAQGEDFLEKWLKAKSIEGIRDVVLLGERTRDV